MTAILRHHRSIKRGRRVLSEGLAAVGHDRGLPELIGRFAGKAAIVVRGAAEYPRDQRRCRICSCTETRACTDGDGMPCCWVEADLCSACVPSARPNYHEMDHIKRLFFRDDECAMQLHVEATEHVNNHPRCLHLWRPHDEKIPRPPSSMVGVASMSTADMQRAINAADELGIPRHVLREAMVDKARREGQR